MQNDAAARDGFIAKRLWTSSRPSWTYDVTSNDKQRDRKPKHRDLLPALRPAT